MAIAQFEGFGRHASSAHLEARARVRRTIDQMRRPEGTQACADRSQSAASEGAEDDVPGSVDGFNRDLGFDAATVADDLTQRVVALVDEWEMQFRLPIGPVEAALVFRPELALLEIAELALRAILNAPEGISGSCDELHQRTKWLGEFLRTTGEVGAVAGWEPEAVATSIRGQE